MSALTVEQFRQALPDKVKKSINQELIDQINTTLSDPDMYEAYRDNLLSYTRVMSDGRFKVTDYISAVKYVSHKLMGATNIEAYSKTFPDKIQRFAQQGCIEGCSFVCDGLQQEQAGQPDHGTDTHPELCPEPGSLSEGFERTGRADDYSQ